MRRNPGIRIRRACAIRLASMKTRFGQGSTTGGLVAPCSQDSLPTVDGIQHRSYKVRQYVRETASCKAYKDQCLLSHSIFSHPHVMARISNAHVQGSKHRAITKQNAPRSRQLRCQLKSAPTPVGELNVIFFGIRRVPGKSPIKQFEQRPLWEKNLNTYMPRLLNFRHRSMES